MKRLRMFAVIVGIALSLLIGTATVSASSAQAGQSSTLADQFVKAPIHGPSPNATSVGKHPAVGYWSTYRQYYADQVWELTSPNVLWSATWSPYGNFASVYSRGGIRWQTGTYSPYGAILSFDNKCNIQIALMEGGPPLYSVVVGWRSPRGLTFVPDGGCRIAVGNTGNIRVQAMIILGVWTDLWVA